MISVAERDASPGPNGLTDRQFDAVATVFVFLSYFAVFLVVRSERSLWDAVLSSLLNLFALLAVAVPTRAIVRDHVLGASASRQAILHIGLATAFTLVWYWSLMILIGVRTGGSFTEFAVRAFFPAPVFAWQLLQGIFIYALLAVLTHLRELSARPSIEAMAGGDLPIKEASLSRYFIRREDYILPVDVSQIVHIKGADDYAEVTTSAGRHLVKTTLSDFEASLPSTDFLRVHRSQIVNLNMIDRAEPTGDGRFVLHMQTGEAVQTSRAGAKLLRDKMI